MFAKLQFSVYNSPVVLRRGTAIEITFIIDSINYDTFYDGSVRYAAHLPVHVHG